MPLKFISVCFLLFICLWSKAKAQEEKLDSISANLYNYGLAHNNSKLFIHFDKNVYANNDRVWFTGYLLNTVTDLTQYNTLYLSLVNNQDSTVVLQQKFLISDGFCFGGFTLPDSLISSDYSFVANTNLKINGKPDGEFIQPITIKSTTVNPLIANLSIFKEYDNQTKNGTALFKAISSDNRFVPNADVKYTIGRKDQILQRGTAKSSVIGEIMIDYPADKINNENNLLSVFVKKGNQTRYIKMDLPVQKSKKYTVQFYPEGGNLIDGLWCKVGFEIKDEVGSAIMGRAVLFENKTVKDTLKTNSSGIGSFLIKPILNHSYSVKLLREDKEDAIYDLPASLPTGMAVRVVNAIVGNELVVKLESTSNTKVHVLLHNFSEIYSQTSLDLSAKNIQSVRFKLDSIPLGLQTITILDNSFKPVAERIFFAHHDQINRMEIKTDQEEYHVREKIDLKLKIIGNNDETISGIVSVACVQANRFALKNQLNIIDYAYLHYNLGMLPSATQHLKYLDKDYLESVLLVKGWRKYVWPKENQSIASLNIAISSYDISGSILKNKKPLNTPMGINVFADKNIYILSTDSIGRFIIPHSNLLSSESSKAWLNLANRNYLEYEVKINEPQEEIKKYVTSKKYFPYTNKNNVIDEVNSNLKKGEINLKEVTITASNSAIKTNKCGDYVCRFNILNCENHRGSIDNTTPIKGQMYVTGLRKFIYQGCIEKTAMPNVILLEAINLPKEFYVADITNKNEPINFPTIYWNYQFAIGNQETPLSFNTGDLTGKFKIIIQGITENGVIYGEKEIVIKNP
nr:hypothetical protein [Pedobacter sp. ASV2]